LLEEEGRLPIRKGEKETTNSTIPWRGGKKKKGNAARVNESSKKLRFGPANRRTQKKTERREKKEKKNAPNVAKELKRARWGPAASQGKKQTSQIE